MARRMIGEWVNTATQAAIRIYWDAEWEEFTCGTGEAKYHTDSLEDAKRTAQTMLGAEHAVFIGRPFRCPEHRR